MGRNLHIILLCIALTALNNTPIHGQLKANHGINILPNGKFAEGEWNDANTFEVKDKFKLLLKQDSLYLYVGLKFIDTMHTGIDLYISDQAGILKKLHVSSAIGEMDYNDGTWSDWKWGVNDLWMANSIGWISEGGKQKIVPLEGFEFQIKKTILPGHRWFSYFHLKRPDFIFPESASQQNTEAWFIMEH